MSPAQHIEWLNLVEKAGPFLAVGVLEESFPQGLEKVDTPKRQRVRSAYDEWRDAVDEQDPQLDALHRAWVRLVLVELLEYDPSVLKSLDGPSSAIPHPLSFTEPLTGAQVRPDFAVLSGETPRLLITRCPPDTDLSAPMAGEAWAASPIERMTALCRAVGVRVGLVTDGEQWTVVSVPADGASSVGTWYARIWQQEQVTLQAFVSLLEVRRCFGPAEANLDSLFLRSLEHQNEVTDTLGEQVRRAVEVLVQALDRADLDRDRQLLRNVSPAQLYEGGLTVMMRLVVLLCAEERKLLLLGEPIYDQHYAVSTLRSRLREDKERLGDEVLERRHDAWSRLLAVFRAVFGGIEHEALRLPALGGSLFDPDRFPFLEGRAAGTAWRDTPAVPLPIDNRTVLMLLTALQVLEQRTGALLLSYEALDVEQIGHVYEGLLERTVKRVPETTLGLIGSQKAVNPNVPLRELETEKSAGNAKLLAYLAEKTGRSESGLKSALTKIRDEALYNRVLLASGSDLGLADRIEPFSLLLRTDNWGDPLVYRQGAFMVTLGAGRRETGTHFTPKPLTEPVVQHTLEPLVYIGPAEGKPRTQWKLRSSREILDLKVCDLAMGSGAFLVQACRWLAERLLEAWAAEEKEGRAISIEGLALDTPGDVELLPRDRAERVLIARRLVASRCLYGVDINPMAVELAKVSLWLVTMMKNRPFTFLDHALKCGDSLLGVSSLDQIENFSLRPGERQVTFGTVNLFRYIEEASAKRRALEGLPSNDAAQIEAKNRLHAEAEAATAKVKALADCLIAFELRGLDGKAYEEQRAEEADKVQLLMKRDADASLKSPISNAQSALAAHAREQLHGRRPFHWPMEFPEVFGRGGFDSFVGNPPFMKGSKVRENFGATYLDFLLAVVPDSHGKADLCAFFVRRPLALMHAAGCAGLVATNTITQGASRITGLSAIVAAGAHIFRGIPTQKWPGNASVEIALIWYRNSRGQFPHVLTDTLTEGADFGGKELKENSGVAFIGVVVIGKGFEMTSEERRRAIALDPHAEQVIRPYMNGSELNKLPDQCPTRWIINFADWPLTHASAPPGYPGFVAEDYPVCLAQLRERVKPMRDGMNRKAYRERWWQFAEKQLALARAIENAERVLVVAKVGKHLAFVFLPAGMVYDQQLVVFTRSNWATFTVLQSTVHYEWARRPGSLSLRTDPQYTVEYSCNTFPWPKHDQTATTQGRNDSIGSHYHEFRREIMQTRQEGLTKTYNRFHNQAENSEDIARLRALHVEMDQAVALAYGWPLLVNGQVVNPPINSQPSTINFPRLVLGHGFHETKQGVRYTLSEPARRTVLDRLLQLNHQRYAEEVAAGLHEKAAKKGKRSKTGGSTEKDLFT